MMYGTFGVGQRFVASRPIHRSTPSFFILFDLSESFGRSFFSTQMVHKTHARKGIEIYKEKVLLAEVESSRNTEE